LIRRECGAAGAKAVKQSALPQRRSAGILQEPVPSWGRGGRSRRDPGEFAPFYDELTGRVKGLALPAEAEARVVANHNWRHHFLRPLFCGGGPGLLKEPENTGNYKPQACRKLRCSIILAHHLFCPSC
jgi:hypothetical protein